MALADIGAEEDRPAARPWLALTALLGVAFLGVKLYAWHDEYRHGLVPFLGPDVQYDRPDPYAAALFFRTCFALAGLHATHPLVGIGALAPHRRRPPRPTGVGADALLALRRRRLAVPVPVLLPARARLVTARRAVLAWAAPSLLLALTVTLAHAPVGAGDTVASFGIAATEAALITLV